MEMKYLQANIDKAILILSLVNSTTPIKKQTYINYNMTYIGNAY